MLPTRLAGESTSSGIYMGAGDFNSDPQAWAASLLNGRLLHTWTQKESKNHTKAQIQEEPGVSALMHEPSVSCAYINYARNIQQC